MRLFVREERMMKGFSSERACRFARVALAAVLLAALLVGVSATTAGAITVPEINPTVSFDPPIAQFGVGLGQEPPGAMSLTVTISDIPEPYTATWAFGAMPVEWLTITPNGGNAPGSTTLNIAIDTTHSELQIPGSYETSVPIIITPNDLPTGYTSALAASAASMPVKVVVRNGAKISCSVNPARYSAVKSPALPCTSRYPPRIPCFSPR